MNNCPTVAWHLTVNTMFVVQFTFERMNNFYVLAMVIRQSSEYRITIQHSMFYKLGRKWGKDCLDISIKIYKLKQQKKEFYLYYIIPYLIKVWICIYILRKQI